MANLLEDVFELPGSRLVFIAVALLSVPGVRRQLRPAARAAVRAGYFAGERIKEWAGEAREQAEDIVAEARADVDSERSPNGDEPRATAPRPRPAARRRTTRAAS